MCAEPNNTANSQSQDMSLLAELVKELNISRRNVTSYPEEHPLIKNSLAKAISLLGHILEIRDRVTFGVIKDSLMVWQNYLDNKNPVFRDFATTLFNRGIAAVTFIRDLNENELLMFNEILNKDPEEIAEKGGIEQIINSFGILHIQVTAIDYSLLGATEEELIDDFSGQPIPLWEGFVYGLMEGTLDPHGEQLSSTFEIDPETLARVLNESPEEVSTKTKGAKYEQTITSFMKKLGGERIAEESESESSCVSASDNFSKFVGKLKPDLKRQFLSGMLKTMTPRHDLAKKVLPMLPSQLVIEAFEDVNQQETYIPPTTLSVLKKLANISIDKANSSQLVAAERKDSEAVMKEKLQNIFNEDADFAFLPESYQDTLDTIMATEQISASEEKEIIKLTKTMDELTVEPQVACIIFEIMKYGPTEEELEVLKRNLQDLCKYFLDTGDISSLIKIYENHTRADSQGRSPLGVSGGICQFGQADFLGEILDGLAFWEKEKHAEINTLIQKIGQPFIKPMLDRLAVEPSISIRRFLIDRLSEMGAMAKDGIISRLDDERWYFIRNLVLILRNINDPGVLEHLHNKINHSHHKVRLETLKAMLQFQDPDAEQMLLKDMESQDTDVRINAVKIAAYSKSKTVFDKLKRIISKSPFMEFDFDFDFKKAVIHALADIGNTDVLPALKRFLYSRSLFHPVLHNRLKTEVVRSLGRYPVDDVIAILEKIAGSQNEEQAMLARAAIQTAKSRGRL